MSIMQMFGYKEEKKMPLYEGVFHQRFSKPSPQPLLPNAPLISYQQFEPYTSNIEDKC
jgi:hypothetical protein